MVTWKECWQKCSLIQWVKFETQLLLQFKLILFTITKFSLCHNACVSEDTEIFHNQTLSSQSFWRLWHCVDFWLSLFALYYYNWYPLCSLVGAWWFKLLVISQNGINKNKQTKMGQICSLNFSYGGGKGGGATGTVAHISLKCVVHTVCEVPCAYLIHFASKSIHHYKGHVPWPSTQN